MGSRALSAPGPKKSKTESKKSQNSWKIVDLDSFSTPFCTFWAPGPGGAGRAREPIFELHLQLSARRAEMTPVAGPGIPNPEPRSEVAPANQTKERSVHELFTGAFRNKSSICEFRACFPKERHQNSQMGEIHELFVLALSLVWFAKATPAKNGRDMAGAALRRGHS